MRMSMCGWGRFIRWIWRVGIILVVGCMMEGKASDRGASGRRPHMSLVHGITEIHGAPVRE